MKKYLLIYAVLITALLIVTFRHYRHENTRLTQNQTALATSLDHYKTQLGKEAASGHVLRLQCAEFEELRREDAAHIRQLGVKLRRLESAAKSVTATTVEVQTLLRDTVIVRDTLRLFRWRDAWVTVEGLINRDLVQCRVESIDTLRQVVHRIPHRFLFIRWGTKALRQEIVSSNPHTRIIHSEFIRIEK